MLRRSFHGWRIRPEIQKVTAIRMPSPHLNPVRVSPASPAGHTPLSPLPPLFFYRQNLRPLSHFPFAHQTSTFSLSTSSVGVDDGREHDGDGDGDGERSGRRRSGMVFTCVSEDGRCDVYLFRTKHGSQELCGEVACVLTCVTPQVVYSGDVGTMTTLESLKRNPKVVNEVEVYPGQEHRVAFEEALKYGGKVANKLEAYLGHGFRVAYEEAMKYGHNVMLRPFPKRHNMLLSSRDHFILKTNHVDFLRQRMAKNPKFLDAPDTQRIIYRFTCLRSPSRGKIWCGKMSLWEKIEAIHASLIFEKVILLRDCRKMTFWKKLKFIHSYLWIEKGDLKGPSEKWAASAVGMLSALVSFLISCGEKIEFIHSSLLMKKHENLLEGPLKKSAVSTVKMLSSLGVSVAGVAILSGIYFGWKK